MGAWITNNHIEIANKTIKKGILEYYSHKDIDEEFISKLVSSDKIKTIQISEQLQEEGYQIIDKILERKPDLVFRIYSLYDKNKFDISFLERMSHLKNLRIDCHLVENSNKIDFDVITRLNLNSLYLSAFDLKDYSFVQHLSQEIEILSIHADTMGKAINFDCRWLLQYKNLHTLWLGKKAKKNMECLVQMASLKSFYIRGIKLKSFDFLKEMKLERLHLLWNSNNELSELKELKTLKEIGLWRINKLNNIDFISNLENLEIIKLQDLRHITKLPDMSRLHNLKRIVLDNTGIQIEELDEKMKAIVVPQWL